MSSEQPSASVSTQALLERVRAGDDEALERLYARYLSPLQRWARGRLPRWARDLMDTEDLVQDTLMNTLQRVGEFDPHHSGAFQAYLRRGVLNRIRSEIRRVGRKPPRHQTAGKIADPRPSPLEEAIGSDALERYETAMEKLDDVDREAIIARVELGFPYRQVAVALGKPSADAARMTVGRALLRLATHMSGAR